MELQDNNEYTITISDVIDNSEFTDSDLVGIFGEGLEYNLTNLSKRTYRAMYSAYNGWNIDQQMLEMKYIINNDTDKKQVMLEAIVEYVRGAMYSGLDMQVYLGNKGYSNEVKDILYNGGLWIIEEISAIDEDKAV